MTMLIQPIWHELLSRRGDWLLERTDEAVAWRKRLLRRARLQNIALMSDMCREAKRERAVLAEKYGTAVAPDLVLMSEVNTTYDIREVLELALVPGKGEEHRRHRFEAMSLFDQACLLSAIDTADSFRTISEDLRRLLGEFNERLFGDRSRHVQFQLAQNPGEKYRVRRIAIDAEVADVPEGWLIRDETRFCREVREDGFVMVDDRPKTPYETYLKTTRRREGNEQKPFEVDDKCGLKMIVSTDEGVLALRDRVGEMMLAMKGVIRASQENITVKAAVDPRNPHSSDDFRAAKLLADWDERAYEIQICTFQDYFSSLYSTGRENHALYKLGKCLDVYFPILFPSEIYGHPWHDPALREDLETDKKDQLERFAKRKRRY
jgi:hypothetical protein